MVVSWENEGPESGEFFFHGKLRQKISLNARKGAQNWPSQHVNSHFLIDQPRTSALGAAVELLFSLPLIWAFSSSRLGFSQLYFQSDFFHICSVGFLSHLSGYFFHVYFPPLKLHASPFLPFGTSLPLIWALLFQSLRHLWKCIPTTKNCKQLLKLVTFIFRLFNILAAQTSDLPR